MKKKFALILAAMFALSTMLTVTSCKEEEKPVVEDNDDEKETKEVAEETEPAVEELDAAKIINDAVSKTQALDYLSIDADILAKLQVEALGMNMDIPMTVTTLADRSNPDNVIIDVVQTTDMGELLGGKTETRTYTEGEWQYVIDEYGDSYKTKVAEGEEITVDDYSQVLPESVFEGKTLTKNDDGSYSIDLDIPAEEIANVFKGADVTELLGGEDATVTKMAVKITVKGEYLASYDIYLELAGESEGIAMAITMDMKAIYNNPGEKVTITPPEGYQDFEDYSYDFDFDWDEEAIDTDWVDDDYDFDYDFDYDLSGDVNFDDIFGPEEDFDFDMNDIDFGSLENEF